MKRKRTGKRSCRGKAASKATGMSKDLPVAQYMTKRGKISGSSLDFYQPKRTASKVRELRRKIKTMIKNEGLIQNCRMTTNTK